jgi:hypothetical protein
MQYRVVFFNAVDVPEDVQAEVMRLLSPYDLDIRVEDREGRS